MLIIGCLQLALLAMQTSVTHPTMQIRCPSFSVMSWELYKNSFILILLSKYSFCVICGVLTFWAGRSCYNYHSYKGYTLYHYIIFTQYQVTNSTRSHCIRNPFYTGSLKQKRCKSSDLFIIFLSQFLKIHVLASIELLCLFSHNSNLTIFNSLC